MVSVGYTELNTIFYKRKGLQFPGSISTISTCSTCSVACASTKLLPLTGTMFDPLHAELFWGDIKIIFTCSFISRHRDVAHSIVQIIHIWKLWTCSCHIANIMADGDIVTYVTKASAGTNDLNFLEYFMLQQQKDFTYLCWVVSRNINMYLDQVMKVGQSCYPV